MTTDTSHSGTAPVPTGFGPVRFTRSSSTTLRPARGTITAGLWHERRRVNRTVSVPAGWDRLHEAGNFHNLELAAGRAEGSYTNDLPFLDSDVYKWLEGIAWVFADPELDADLRAKLGNMVDQTVDLLEATQQDDGYLDSNFQVRTPGERFVHLDWGHELYCAGHLIQAAVAMHRTTADERLLGIARRFADLIAASFADGKIESFCGHPEIETALVELGRETGEQSYLDTARLFLERRGHRTMPGRFGYAYWQDHAPIRDTDSVEGHSVRQLYLLAGVADLYAETGDSSWLEAGERLWHEMAARKTYITGGIGSHHADEAFGDPYELPSERSYCETCASIASVMFSWRMLLATGEAKYADLMERTLYNGFLAGTSLDGQRYIYANPLQVREGHLDTGTDHDYQRVPWFHCACCPPNVMRLLGSLDHYLAAAAGDDLVVHQYATGTVSGDLDAGAVSLDVVTDYPWDGTVGFTVTATPAASWTLVLRVPHWAEGATAQVNGAANGASVDDGWLRITRGWTAGDTVSLTLPMRPRFSQADPRVDALRHSEALERGPLVYCLEATDNQGVRFDDVVVDTTSPLAEQPASGLDGILALTAKASIRAHRDAGWWPYGPRDETAGAASVDVTAVPYYAWGNRDLGAMRVWLPTT